jgi:prepilin-type N-terminal cleavage/methylation domain-containing protein
MIGFMRTARPLLMLDSRMVRLASPRTRGFTLVEMMIVTVIVGVLAVLAVYGVSKYIASSKTGEAIQMIGSIKAAQESFKDETFSYLNVTGDLTKFYPTNSKPGQIKVGWGGAGEGATNWKALGVNPGGAVLFQYACSAGTAAQNVESPGSDIPLGNWPTALGQPWYAVKAVADLNAGGSRTVYVAASFTNQIFSAHEGE